MLTTFSGLWHPLTMDVTALYSSIPIEEGIQTALRLVKENWDDIDTIDFELSELEDLLRFLLTNSFFGFGGDIYQQKVGVAMGSRLAPPFAILFMHDLEGQWIRVAN